MWARRTEVLDIQAESRGLRRGIVETFPPVVQRDKGRAGTDMLGYALLLAIAIHGAAIIGIGFVPEALETEPQRHQSLRVVLVQRPAAPEAPAEKVELLAQATRTGSGNSVRTRPANAEIALAPPPPPPPPPRAVAAPEPAKPSPPQPAPAEAPPPPPAAPRQRSTPPVTAAQLLASRKDEIALLTSELERKSAQYSSRPRRKAVSASTTEYKYAAYLEAWRRKVERIGNLNYPDEARRKKVFGDLVLHVAVRADGSVERIRVLHSSGHRLLDDAAVRIVRLAAPFSPFPPDIQAETDVLDITRTWQFLSSNRLGWK
jgi:protein TonB